MTAFKSHTKASPFIWNDESRELVNGCTGEVISPPESIEFRITGFIKIPNMAIAKIFKKIKTYVEIKVFFTLFGKMNYYGVVVESRYKLLQASGVNSGAFYKAINNMYKRGIILLLSDGGIVVNPIFACKGSQEHITALVDLFLEHDKSGRLQFKNKFYPKGWCQYG